MAATSQEGYLSYEVTLGSKTFKSEGDIISIHTVNEVNRIPTAVISFVDGSPADQKFKVSDESYLDPGGDVKIKLGYKGTTVQVFDGVIIKHAIKVRNNSSITVVECKHKSTKMTIGRKTRYYEKKDDKAIITSLFSENGISSAVACSGTFISEDSQLQYEISDWDYFMTRCEINSKIACYTGSKYEVQDPKISGSASLTFKYGTDLFEFESEFDARTQLKKVEATAWDPATQKVQNTTGAASGFKQLENKGVKASDLESIAAPTSFELFHSGTVSEKELAGWTKAYNTRASLAKARGRAKINGNPDVKIGDIVELEGVGKKFSGKVLVSGIRHEFNANGFFTNLQFGLEKEMFTEKYNIHSKPAGGLTGAVNGLQIGTVEKIDEDPDSGFRIQVNLPTVGKDTKVWARILFPDAGKNRGFHFWPEKDDEVVVGFMNDDPRFPVVLGSVFNKKNTPVVKPEAKNNKRAIVSKSEIKLEFDDEKKILTISTPGGHKVTMDDDGKTLELEDLNGSKVTLDKAGISLNSSKDIELKSSGKILLKSSGDISLAGNNVEVKANAKFAASGNSGVDIKSSANATIKGTMVQIN